MLILTIPLTAAALAPLAWRRRGIYGYATAIISYSFYIVLIIRITFSSLLGIAAPEWMFALYFGLFCLSILSLLFAIPYAVIPKLRGTGEKQVELAALELQRLDISAIEKRLDHIRASLNAVQRSVKDEGNEIETAIDTLLAGIKEKNTELQKMNEKQHELLAEIDRYRNLASITEKQAEAVAERFRRGKYLDYIIGLIVGVISAIIGYLMIEYFKSFK
ncbi:MAG: hypothetical protein NT002_10575 [candidate division Zixibacteria bacterium]|nr:hypothetical protein [candidate division Zixibacteria bacterium]